MASAVDALRIKGSSRVVSDYFEICIHNILFQRNIYPKEDFKVIRKFGLNLVFCKNEEINQYIKRIIRQLHRWIFDGKISWLTLLILSKETNQISEKWMFHIDVTTDIEQPVVLRVPIAEDITQTQKEIQAIIRQITSSITFLPHFDELQTFRILVHTSSDIEPSKDWDDAKPFKDMESSNSESVGFNKFTADNYGVSTFVTYKTLE